MKLGKYITTIALSGALALAAATSSYAEEPQPHATRYGTPYYSYDCGPPQYDSSGAQIAEPC